MDIDDILASVSDGSAEQEPLDLQALTRAWVSERTAPELLPYPTALIDRMNDRISKQIVRVEDLTSAMDPTSNFSLVVIQTELERIKFLMRSFLRARIAKIDAYPLHYLSQAQKQAQARTTSQAGESQPSDLESMYTDTGTAAGRGGQRGTEQHNPLLSPTEQQYAHHHTALLNAHYASSFLSSFPPALQKMDDTGGGISMIDAPDLDTAVFVRVLRDAGTVEIYGKQGTAEIELRRGDVWVLRWRAVRESVVKGDLEMI